MEKCLAFSPKRRLDVTEALRHPYLGVCAFLLEIQIYLTNFKPYHDADDEPEAAPLDPSFFDFDLGEPLSREELKGMRATIPLFE